MHGREIKWQADWFTGFMSRNKNLPVRKPEATSVPRMASFNLFMRWCNDSPKRSQNCWQKSEHQVGQVVNRERSELVTHVEIICVGGSSFSPVWIFLNGVEQNELLGLVHYTICMQAWDKDALSVNIKSGLECTGMAAFDRNVFKEDDFSPASVTDWPATMPENTTPWQVTNVEQLPISRESLEKNSSPINKTCYTKLIFTEVLCSCSKALMRKDNKRAQKKKVRDSYRFKYAKIIRARREHCNPLVFDVRDDDDEANIEEVDYVIAKVFDTDRKNSLNYGARIEMIMKKFLNRYQDLRDISFKRKGKCGAKRKTSKKDNQHLLDSSRKEARKSAVVQ
ncbi:hypothetical protein ILUMI_04309 [Ignelater luminosus]|uniref:Uncharacterized protein n=1 Tax=Ignelater luminosus TaxID=2038154 RepID=A0A8K0DEQ1_IGNLU|nr:hypothetical protein ILUMI_04309 [Ignelater luminosus]